ncbi:MAG: hypothetical protein U9R68_04735 [Planctomycetota bacterium]|nr:hypothetical protein [Planctomycetota bacterium]
MLSVPHLDLHREEGVGLLLVEAETEAEAARRLFDELEAMRLWNPVWQMTGGRAVYARLLKWLLEAIDRTDAGPARRPLYRMATTCYYRLGRYAKWEAGQTLLGLTTAREIEKALRWDKMHDFDGKGFQIVSEYLARDESGPDRHERGSDTAPRVESKTTPAQE